jgi:hypothetical protein
MGQHQTFLSALPTLLRLRREPGKVVGLLGCATSPRLHPVPEQAREVHALDWSVCPLDLLACDHLQGVERLDQLAKVAPLAGWPDRYAAWAVSGLMTLREARGG